MNKALLPFAYALALIALPFSLIHAGGVYEPADGKCYFGFTVRAWDDLALTNWVYGDQRPFDERYRDSIQMELAGRQPAVYGFVANWQNDDGTPVAFADSALPQIQQ